MEQFFVFVLFLRPSKVFDLEDNFFAEYLHPFSALFHRSISRSNFSKNYGLRVIQAQAILCWKLISVRGGSDIERSISESLYVTYSRIRLFPRLISIIELLVSGLPLTRH